MDWCIDRCNAEANRRYQKTVAHHAGQGSLVGTWNRTYTKPYKTPNEWHETVSLYADGTYAKRLSGGMFLARTSVTFTTGEWKRIDSGVIELSQPSSTTPEVMRLGEWTNSYVQADMQLQSVQHMESHNKAPEDIGTNAPNLQH